MYKIEKRFTLPIGHRLSKHKGRCFSFHGHNFIVLVGLKSNILDKNDMVMDFSQLKSIVGEHLDGLDHCTMLNACDHEIGRKLMKMGSRIIFVDHDPTAEKLSEMLYKNIKRSIETLESHIKMDYVIVYENEDSKATYSED